MQRLSLASCSREREEKRIPGGEPGDIRAGGAAAGIAVRTRPREACMFQRIIGAALTLGLVVVAASAASAQTKYDLKLAYFVGDQHAMSQWLIKWSEKLEKDSGGRIAIKRFPASQMGSVQQHYDFARTGQADIVWLLHGATPGRFPLTEVIQLPYLVGSAEIGTKVLNDADLRGKYLDAEHRGVKVLFLLTHQPGNVHTTRKPIRGVEDMKGLRIRFASPTIRDFIAALGGTPVGVLPTEQVEQLQKGTIDGVFIDYGGAGIAFKMGGILKYSTEMYSYVSSFGMVMNEDTWKKLPPDVQKLVAQSVTGIEKEVGEAWDALDGPGKKALLDGGDQIIKLSPEENSRFHKIGAEVAEAKVKELESKGLPARSVYSLMKSLAEKHARTSRTF